MKTKIEKGIEDMLSETLEIGKRLGRVEEQNRILKGIGEVFDKWPVGVWGTIRHLFDVTSPKP